jgi:hypothetical protein
MIMGKTREIDGDQEQFWRMAIETWQASGLPIRQFCKNEGLSEPQFYMWRKKLTGGSTEHDDQDDPKPSSFIEVAIPKNNHVAVELLLTSGNTVRIHSGINNTTLSNVLSALHAEGLC